MCIGVPMRVREHGEVMALCEGRGKLQRINMLMVGDCPPGSWVMTFLGVARDVLSEEDAAEINRALDELESILRGEAVFEGRLPDFGGK
jgi:hydrogenase expression/formation protein HypC